MYEKSYLQLKQKIDDNGNVVNSVISISVDIKQVVSDREYKKIIRKADKLNSLIVKYVDRRTKNDK